MTIKLIEFSAPWCPVCQMMKPIMEEIKTEIGGKVEVNIVNSEDDMAFAEKYNVMTLPTILILDGMAVIKEWHGAVSKYVIMEELNKLICR